MIRQTSQLPLTKKAEKAAKIVWAKKLPKNLKKAEIAAENFKKATKKTFKADPLVLSKTFSEKI